LTCIVGLVHEGEIYMGADSAGVGGNYSISTHIDPKVFVRDHMIFGYTSSFRLGQLIQYSLTIPFDNRRLGDSPMKYMVADFIPALRHCLKDGGYATKINEEERMGVFLVGYKDQLYKIDCDYQVARYDTPYMATGCGEQIALGSLYQTVHLAPHHRIQDALQAAAFHNAAVRPPFTILKLGKDA